MGASLRSGGCLRMGLGFSLWACLAGLAFAPVTASALQVDADTLFDKAPTEKPYPVKLHFLTSNERRHDLFFPALAGRGGAYLGVASDQNYTLAAIARAEILFLFDIDSQIIEWHQIYGALLAEAESPQVLRSLLSETATEKAKALIQARYPTLPETAHKSLLNAYLRDRWRLFAHVGREIRNPQRNWLNDQALYSYIRGLHMAHKVIARVGDLHGDHTLVEIGNICRSLSIPVRVVYISNVEQWFHYTPQLRRNLESLPSDDRTILLRTLARRELPRPIGDRWHFSVQSLGDFVASLHDPKGPKRVHDLMPIMRVAPSPLVGLSHLGVTLLAAAKDYLPDDPAEKRQTLLSQSLTQSMIGRCLPQGPRGYKQVGSAALFAHYATTGPFSPLPPQAPRPPSPATQAQQALAKPSR